MTMTDVYTFTLGSGHFYTVTVEASSGDIFLTTVFLCLAALAILDAVFTLIYRR